jgi:hypothetical protein
MIRFGLFIVFTTAPLFACAQLQGALTAGYGFYRMSDMKTFQEELHQDLALDTRVTSSFPGYWFYELSITSILPNDMVLGGNLSYGSTGGRIHYRDYSGEVGSDQRIYFFSLSPSLGTSFTLDDESWRFLVDLKPGMVYSKFEFDVYQRIGQTRDSEDLGFASMNLSVQPTVTVQKKFGRFGVHATVGYHATVVRGKLYFEDNEDAYLLDNKGDEVYADWSGVRLGAGVHINILE